MCTLLIVVRKYSVVKVITNVSSFIYYSLKTVAPFWLKIMLKKKIMFFLTYDIIIELSLKTQLFNDSKTSFKIISLNFSSEFNSPVLLRLKIQSQKGFQKSFKCSTINKSLA